MAKAEWQSRSWVRHAFAVLGRGVSSGRGLGESMPPAEDPMVGCGMLRRMPRGDRASRIRTRRSMAKAEWQSRSWVRHAFAVLGRGVSSGRGLGESMPPAGTPTKAKAVEAKYFARIDVTGS